VALLSTLPVLYPQAEQVPEALALGALLHLEAGRKRRAEQMAFELLSTYPSHRTAGRAFMVLARSEFDSGHSEQALVALGKAQLFSDEDPATSNQALDMANQVDRLSFALGRSSGRLYEVALDPAPFVLPDRAEGLVFSRSGTLYAAVPREGGVLVYHPGSLSPERIPMGGVQAVAVDRWDRLWVAGEFGVQAPGGEVIVLPERAEIISVAPVGVSTAWVVDGRSGEVIRLDAGSMGEGVRAQLPERFDPIVVVSGVFGGAWILDKKLDALLQVGADGTALKFVPLEEIINDPVDLVRDDLGHLYLLDAKGPALIVLSPAGELLKRQLLPTEGEPSLAKAKALAVNRAGDVVIHESRKKRVIWLR